MGCKTSIELLGLKRRDARAKRQSAEKKTGAEHARPDVVKEDYSEKASPYEQGTVARLSDGYGGSPARNPFHPSSSAHEAWQAGYDGE